MMRMAARPIRFIGASGSLDDEATLAVGVRSQRRHVDLVVLLVRAHKEDEGDAVEKRLNPGTRLAAPTPLRVT
jgi:hypothetical protein